MISDGAFAPSALNIAEVPSWKGIASYFIKILFYNLMLISGRKLGSTNLTVDSQGRVSDVFYFYDVLWRKRACCAGTCAAANKIRTSGKLSRATRELC
jgi:hypothetical protein